MNARKTIFVIVFFLLAAGLVFAFKGESEHYVVTGIRGLGGTIHGTSEHYDVELTIGHEPAGYGCSEHYCVCLGYYCEEEKKQLPCEPPTEKGKNWVIPANTEACCR